MSIDKPSPADTPPHKPLPETPARAREADLFRRMLRVQQPLSRDAAEDSESEAAALLSPSPGASEVPTWRMQPKEIEALRLDAKQAAEGLKLQGQQPRKSDTAG